MVKVSVIILTYNEEKNIEDCLKSVHAWADEIIVVDSYSTDKTLEIVKDYTNNIYQHPFENFSKQRNWAQGNLPIKNEWVLHLDADERISPELAEEIKRIFSAPIDADGFMMPRKTVFRGRWIRHGGHYPVYQLRLFRKDKGQSEERFYDQNYIVRGKIKKINADIINIITPDLNLWKSNHRKWARLEAAEVILNKGRVMNIRFMGNSIESRNWLRYRIYYKLPLLFIRPFLYFIYRYIFRLGFLDGGQGMVFHFWHGFWYRLLVDVQIFKLSAKIIYGHTRNKLISS